MKMKEAIALTGLTDRAIRLYIENGLVSPSCIESYTGRKNISFTEDDVAELCDIAVLRKAGFSLNEIRELRTDEESCRRVLTEFMSNTSERIQNDKAVLEKLEAVAESESVTMKKICESLNSVTKEKEIPKSDTKFSFGIRLEKRFFTFLASVGLVYIFGCIMYVVLICKFNFDYLYPTIRNVDLYFFAKLFIVLFTVISCVYLIYAYRNKALPENRKKRLAVSIALSVISVFFCWLFFFCTLWSMFSPNVCSKTTNPKNYLVLDDEDPSVTEFFPYEIDSYATYSHGVSDLLINFPDTYPDSTKYYYKDFRDGFSSGDSFTEIIAEWTILEKYNEYSDYLDRYEEYKEKYLKLDFGKPVTKVTKGDWQLVYYNNSTEDNWNKHYFYRIFAVNDKTKTLRFIYAMRGILDPVEESKEIVPEFTKLKW